MKFVMVHKNDGEAVYVNVQHIISISPNNNGGSHIICSNEVYFYVKESPMEIARECEKND